MPAALLGVLRGLGASAVGGIKANPGGFLVRLFRGLFSFSLGSIGFFWYTGWRRERVEPGTGKIPIPGLSKLKAQYPASVGDKALPKADPNAPSTGPANPNPLTPAVNPPGSQTQPGSKHENFDPIRYQHRLHTAQKIAHQYRLHITSGHRSASHNAAVGGVNGSLHIDGLAFDFVGSPTDMSRAMAWAQGQPRIFSEVMVHNVGSGIHLHLAFQPNAGL